MKRQETQQLHPKLLSIASLNFAASMNSSARQDMTGNQLSQAVVIDGCEPRRVGSGMERRYGEATFKVEFNANADVRNIIQKYPRTVGIDDIPLNPLTSLIYVNLKKNQVDIMHLPYHHCLHQHFGFKYKLTERAMQMKSGDFMRAGTRLAHSPALDSHGNHGIGIELKTMLCSDNDVVEDGIVLRRGVLSRLVTNGYGDRNGSFGRTHYPLNTYGTETEIKIFPDMGEHIRKDGLIFAFREFDEGLCGIEMAEDCLREVDPTFDQRVFGVPDGRVVDITVRKGTHSSNGNTPKGMEAQVMKYYTRQRQYYSEVERATQKILEKSSTLTVSPKLDHVIYEGYVFRNDPVNGSPRPKQMYNLQLLDEWRVDLTFEYKVRPNIGSKLTDMHGAKGIVCGIREDEDMPRDAWGNVADALCDGESVISRMNLGRLAEQYLNAHGLQSQRLLKQWKDEYPGDYVEMGWKYLLEVYEAVSPRMSALIQSPEYKGTPRHHVESVIKGGVYYWSPTWDNIALKKSVNRLEAVHPLQIQPVTYKDRNGNTITTTKPVIIGSVYHILLEKTGENEWSAVSSAKLQAHGLPAKTTKHDKYSSPGRGTPVRILGETENRIIETACPDHPAAKLIEMSNSPPLHRHIIANITRAAQPTNIERTITNPELHNKGGRNINFIRHSMEISGVRINNVPASTVEPRVYPPNPGEPSV